MQGLGRRGLLPASGADGGPARASDPGAGESTCASRSGKKTGERGKMLSLSPSQGTTTARIASPALSVSNALFTSSSEKRCVTSSRTSTRPWRASSMTLG